MPCFLCTQGNDDNELRINFNSEEALALNVKQIVEQHFWLRITHANEEMQWICLECWSQLLAFHNFYLVVEQAHKSFSEFIATAGLESKPANADVGAATSIDETNNDDSVAAAVKRRRGRPRRKQLATDDATSDNNTSTNRELKAVLEQINLNEIKIEFPEADLTMADVLEDDEDADTRQYLELSTCGSDEISGSDVHKKAKKSSKGYGGKGKAKGAGMTNIKKSEEFNNYIREHYKIHCHVCSAPMEDFSEMLVHTRKEHKQRGYATCCNRKFWKRGVLVDHLRRHQNPELFKCHLCERVMGQRRSLELHLRMHDIKKGGRLYQCDQCSKSFYSSVVYERHKLTHIPKDQWQVSCTNCEKTFPNEYTMQQHMKLVHLNMYAKICDVCGKSVRGREALARHMEEHTGEPHQHIKCHLCGSTLTTKYGLARHIKMMHTEENLKPMQCEICLKISPTLQAHQHHIKYTHKTARTHQCPLCEKAFKRPNELREHMTTHTGEVLYTCPHCPKTFNSNANMHAHRKKVHRQEWEENRNQRRHLIARNRRGDSIIAASVRKTTATATELPTRQELIMEPVLVAVQDLSVD